MVSSKVVEANEHGAAGASTLGDNINKYGQGPPKKQESVHMVHIRHHTMTPTARTTVTIGLAVPVAAVNCRFSTSCQSRETVASEREALQPPGVVNRPTGNGGATINAYQAWVHTDLARRAVFRRCLSPPRLLIVRSCVLDVLMVVGGGVRSER